MILFWQEMEQRAAWDSVDPKYPVKQIISLLMRQLLTDVMQYSDLPTQSFNSLMRLTCNFSL